MAKGFERSLCINRKQKKKVREDVLDASPLLGDLENLNKSKPNFSIKKKPTDYHKALYLLKVLTGDRR